MINLRFHIVSIVAVFLALAVGIFAGSTLLDKATVKVIQSNQASLDAKNRALRGENDMLRSLAERMDAAAREFSESALDPLVAGQLRDDPLLLIATRGTDESGVETTVATLRNAGSSVVGILWLDKRTDPSGGDDVVTRLATFLDVKPDLSASKRADTVKVITSRFVSLLVTPLSEAAATPATTDTTTTAVPDNENDLAGVLTRLVAADLVDWTTPSGDDATLSMVPTERLRTVIVSGEGADVPADRLMVPLAKGLAATPYGAVVGEIDHRRSFLGWATTTFRRGAVVDPIRSDKSASANTVTIDNVDHPFGRLALVLALSDIDRHHGGAYGETSTAQRQFPDGS